MAVTREMLSPIPELPPESVYRLYTYLAATAPAVRV